MLAPVPLANIYATTQAPASSAQPNAQAVRRSTDLLNNASASSFGLTTSGFANQNTNSQNINLNLASEREQPATTTAKATIPHHPNRRYVGSPNPNSAKYSLANHNTSMKDFAAAVNHSNPGNPGATGMRQLAIPPSGRPPSSQLNTMTMQLQIPNGQPQQAHTHAHQSRSGSQNGPSSSSPHINLASQNPNAQARLRQGRSPVLKIKSNHVEIVKKI